MFTYEKIFPDCPFKGNQREEKFLIFTLRCVYLLRGMHDTAEFLLGGVYDTAEYLLLCGMYDTAEFLLRGVYDTAECNSAACITPRNYHSGVCMTARIYFTT